MSAFQLCRRFSTIVFVPRRVTSRCHSKFHLKAFLIDEVDNYEAELWLNGTPLPGYAVNNLISLAGPALPEGEIDFDNDQDTWVFRSFTPLTDNEKSYVQQAAVKCGPRRTS